jgi:Presenilin
MSTEITPASFPPSDEHEEATTSYQLQHSFSRPVPLNDFGDENGDDDDDNYVEMSLTELLYSSSSFHAIVKPVTLTMILAALSVVYINDEASMAQGQQAMSDAYMVWTTDTGESGSKQLAISLANSLVIVSFICAVTFGIVLLYKLRCMMCLIGYMMFSSATLLGVLGGTMALVAIDVYHLSVDKITFYLGMINFAVVGVMAVFWAKGIPTFVSQGYLIATSVILAWQLVSEKVVEFRNRLCTCILTRTDILTLDYLWLCIRHILTTRQRGRY